MTHEYDYIPLDKCEEGKVYKISSRNLRIGVFDGKGGFIGIREKFGNRYLFTEYHWDKGPPFGTVRPYEEVEVELPPFVVAKETLGSKDIATGREVAYKKPPEAEGFVGKWHFVDTGEASDEIKAQIIFNTPLYLFLRDLEMEHFPQRWEGWEEDERLTRSLAAKPDADAGGESDDKPDGEAEGA